jgi:hypothetical protein
MKARTRTTRWLTVALLFGFLAAVGLTLARHHFVRTLAAHVTAPPTHAAVQPPDVTLVPATHPGHSGAAPAGTRHYRVALDTYSNSQAPAARGHSDPQSRAGTAGGTGRSSETAGPTGDPIGATQPRVNPLVVAETGSPPHAAAGDFAYNGYVPLDCELPAGCGVTAGTGHVSRQPWGTSAGVPSVHYSQGPNSGEDDSGSQTSDGDPLPNDNKPLTDPPGQNSGPGSTPVAAAPELAPATLAGAITLLLGSLAVLRGRRARATR